MFQARGYQEHISGVPHITGRENGALGWNLLREKLWDTGGPGAVQVTPSPET